MRSENEVIQAVCEQVIHGIKNCGWDDSDMDAFSECVDIAMDMVMTDEEAEELRQMCEMILSPLKESADV